MTNYVLDTAGKLYSYKYVTQQLVVLTDDQGRQIELSPSKFHYQIKSKLYRKVKPN
ncbi:hypothetical protein FHS70_004223 [Flammeovirga yaeyamensis]|nr:hypothetical protein [Flammeovirga yaeyamensis]